jgi:hypothetical protein
MRKWLLVLAALAGVVLALEAQSAGVSFTMAFVKRAPDGQPAGIDFSERVHVAPGDLFKILIQPSEGSYVYLILHDAQNDLQVLFPTAFAAFESPGYGRAQTFIPEDDEWFALDGTKGTERFYLVATTVRLKTLESRIAAFQKIAANKGAAAAAVNAARQAVLDEIQVQIKSHSRLVAAAEKPVPIGGGTRGVNNAITRLATRVEAGVFYSKTFRLEH